MLTSFDDAKKIINLKNFFNECYKYNLRCFHPIVVPIEYVLTYMMQSGNYILTPDFINCSYRKINLEEASTLWNIIHEPKDTTLDQILQIIFDPRYHDYNSSGNSFKKQRRYYVQGLPEVEEPQVPRVTSSLNTEDTSANIDSDTCANYRDEEEDEVIEVNIDTTRPSSSTTTTGTAASPNLASRLITQCRTSPLRCASLSQRPNYPTEDIVPLPASIFEEEEDEMVYCPKNLEEMTQLVRQVRSKHPMYSRPIRVNDPPPQRNHRANINNDNAVVELIDEHDHQHPNPTFSKNKNNYQMFCPSDDDEEQFEF